MSRRLLASAALLAGLFTLTPASVPGLRAGEKASPAPHKPKLIQKHYLVADLVTPLGGFAPRRTEPPKPNSLPVWECRTKALAGDGKGTPQDQLLNLILNTVAPDTWSIKGGPGTIDYFPLSMALVVCQTADVQEQVADLLAALRRLQSQEVAIELRILKLDDPFFERLGPDFKSLLSQPVARIEPFGRHSFINDFAPIHPGAGVVGGDKAEKQNVAFLNSAQVSSLLEACQADRRTNVMQAPRITLFNGQQSTLKCLDRQFYVTKAWSVGVGRGGFVFVPSNEPYETGINLSLQPIISGDQRFVRLHIKGTLTDLMTDPVPLAPVKSQIRPVQQDGSDAEPVTFTQFLQVPRFDTVSVDKTLCIPDGGTALLYGWKRERQCREEKGLPLWSELPYIGGLFKSKRDVHYTEHVMLLVTPHVIVPKEEEIVQTGVISNPALVQDDPPSPCRTAEMPPLPGAEETSEMGSVPPPTPMADKPTPDVSKKDPTRRMQGLLIKSETFGPPRKIKPLFWLYEWALHPPLTYDRIHGGIE